MDLLAQVKSTFKHRQAGSRLADKTFWCRFGDVSVLSWNRK